LKERFPGTTCAPFVHPDLHYPSFAVCDLPQPLGGVPFEGGVTARYLREGQARPLLERREPAISYGFFPDQCLVYGGRNQPPCRAEWEGRFRIEEAGRYQLLVQARRAQMSLRIDGKVIHEAAEHPPRWHIDDQVQRGLWLEAGEHEVRLDVKFSSLEYGGARLQIRRDSQEPWRLVRFH
jgi:hypothetical protein